MAEPKGILIVPVGFNPSGDLRGLELDSSDSLKVAFAAAAQGLVGGHGWIGGAWQKNPLQLGYSAVVDEEKSDLNAAAGAVTLNGSVVPAGEVWVIQAISAYNNNRLATRILIMMTSGGVTTRLVDTSPAGVIPTVTWGGMIVLAEGGLVRASFLGTILNDDLYLQYHGVRVDVDQ